MKKIAFFLFPCLMFLQALPCKSQKMYAEEDKQMLRYFLLQPSTIANKLNIDILSIEKIDTSTWKTNESWVTKIKGITWDYDALPQFKIRIIDWSGVAGLSGKLNLEKCTQIRQFYATNSKLSVLKFGKNTNITRINCNNNELSVIDVSGCQSLTYLSCSDNKIKSLNLKNNTMLTYLRCDNNLLGTLNICGNKLLTYLNCANNELTELNIQNNLALTEFLCSNNKLTSLNISNNMLLTKLSCSNNKLRHSSMPIVTKKIANAYNYYPQQIILKAKSDSIDLTKEYIVADENNIKKISSFSWFYIENDDEKPIPNKSVKGNKGLFSIENTAKRKKLRCKIVNPAIGTLPIIFEVELLP